MTRNRKTSVDEGAIAPTETGEHQRAERTRHAYNAPALEKGLSILEFLAGQRRPQSALDIARAISRTRGEIYRMLQVLEARGYIYRANESENYAITNRLFELGMRYSPTRNVHDAALPVMHSLSESILQSCQLVVLSGDYIVVVARVESPAEIGFAIRVGYRRHVTQSTSGRILIGMQPESRRKIWVARLRHSAPDASEYAEFERAVSIVPMRGYEMQPSFYVDGITDISAPVFDGVNPGPVAALTIPFVRGRFSSLDAEEALPQITEAARTISLKLSEGTHKAFPER